MSCRLQYMPRPCGRAPRPHVQARGNLGKALRTSLPDSKIPLTKMDSTGFLSIHKDQLVVSVNTRACRASRARLFKEYKEVQREKSADPDIQLICDDSNIFKWTAVIKGPSETPFEGGVFQLAFSIPEQYPLLPPQVRFITKIFHPNVHFKTGEICLDILKNAWSPAWTLQSVCRAIIALMAHPEADSPLNCDSGNLLRSGDIRGYQSMARMYTRLAAMPKKE
ncbi:Protein PEROXIN-4 [Triticum urartu]|uniref:E2 ubiquitin-conjugating enzyme n=1 Tax=Triticum urartu TaxID=4572 RepID=M7ZUP4_TRIUA|nr:Protein PEROXIN-4 [Triticum urartu]